MEKQPLFTIGHGARKAEDFLELLKRNNIRYLIDVRSKPYSRFHPQFNRSRLAEYLCRYGITYVFMGDALGGRPEDPSCYKDGKPDYRLIAQKDFYKKGIARLRAGFADRLGLAVMCSESKSQMCHRTHLIAASLYADGVEVVHINEKGVLKPHGDIVQERWPGVFDRV